MPIPAIVDAVDALPEAIRPLYRQGDGDLKGKFVLDVEEHPTGYRLENPKPLRSALESERAEFRRVSDQLKQYGDLTPDAVSSLRKQLEALKSNVPAEQVQAMVRAEIDQHRKSWDGEKQKLQSHAERLQSLVRSTYVDTIAKQEALALGADPKHVDLLVRVLRDVAEVEIPEKGDPKVFLKNDAGGVRTSPTGTGDMTIREWIETTARKEYPALFSGGGATGGGRTGGDSGGAGGAFVISAQQVKSNPKRYFEMQDEARKAGQEVKIVQ